MTENTTLMGRIGGWFKRGHEQADLVVGPKTQAVAQALPPEPAPAEAIEMDRAMETRNMEPPVETRSTFIRPWSKRDGATEQLQTGVAALSDLLDSVRESLDRHTKRQDEMMSYLAHLPKALQSIPENGRVQGEALTGIHKQIERQTGQQSQVAQVLERISRAEDRQQRTLEALQDRVDWVSRNEHALTQSLSNVGVLLQAMGKHSEASAQVMVNLRDGMSVRDRNVEKILHRQGVRFTTMLAVAIFLSMAAIVGVGIFGYLGYDILSHLGK
jgi:hypothetical protein